MDLRVYQDGTLRNPAGVVEGRLACPFPLDRIQGTVPSPITVPVRTAEELAAQVERLRQIPQVAQRSDAWHKQRSTRITASEIGAVLGESSYDGPLDVLLRKVGAIPGFQGNAYTLWGQKYEPVAQRLYEYRSGRTLEEFGMIPHSTIPFLGASPDGICTDGRMLEIKCPSTRVIDGNIPRHYYLQMQLQLEVCDLETCDFEECRFSEYPDEDHFLMDADEDGRSKTSRLEVGVMVEREGNVWVHMPSLGMKPSDMVAWAKNQTGKPIYWKLEQYSCVEVTRDRAWFARSLPVLEHFWLQVCFYRVMGAEHLAPLIPRTRKYADVLRRIDPHPQGPVGSSMRFLSDSESEDELEVTQSDDDMSSESDIDNEL